MCLPTIAPGPYSNYNNVRIAMIQTMDKATDEAIDNASGNVSGKTQQQKLIDDNVKLPLRKRNNNTPKIYSHR